MPAGVNARFARQSDDATTRVDGERGCGYSVGMEYASRRSRRHRRRFFPGLLVTIAWMVPAMGALGIGGFYFARQVLAPRYLKDSRVQQKLHPVAILSPEEAAKLQKDRTSHVWSEGVQASDIPALQPTDDRSGGDSPRERPHRRTRVARPRGTGTTPAPDTTPAPEPTPPSETGNDGGAPETITPDAGGRF